MLLRPLLPSDLPDAIILLRAACVFDSADIVAHEKLFGAAPHAEGVHSIAAIHNEQLVGVAAVDGNRIRLLAVTPDQRLHGIGTALLAWCEQHARAGGHPRIWALGQAGNYLAPGIDTRNQPTIDWLLRRGWQASSDIRTNLIVATHDNPLVSPTRVRALAAEAATRGYQIRRARHDETRLLDAIAAEFGGAWPFEVERAMHWQSRDLAVGVHVATRGDDYCAFAAHNGNNTGLGWFGPAGTWPAHRGHRLGEAVLIACLLDVATDHSTCEIAWIGPEPFYQKSCGIVGRRTFVAMKREFTEDNK